MARSKGFMFDKPEVELAKLAKALGHPARVNIVSRLVEAGQLNFLAIVHAMPIKRSTVSDHLEKLDNAGLILPILMNDEVVGYQANPFMLARYETLVRQQMLGTTVVEFKSKLRPESVLELTVDDGLTEWQRDVEADLG